MAFPRPLSFSLSLYRPPTRSKRFFNIAVSADWNVSWIGSMLYPNPFCFNLCPEWLCRNRLETYIWLNFNGHMFGLFFATEQMCPNQSYKDTSNEPLSQAPRSPVQKYYSMLVKKILPITVLYVESLLDWHWPASLVQIFPIVGFILEPRRLVLAGVERELNLWQIIT